jgi:excisionase family DNA binding protein
VSISHWLRYRRVAGCLARRIRAVVADLTPSVNPGRGHHPAGPVVTYEKFLLSALAENKANQDLRTAHLAESLQRRAWTPKEVSIQLGIPYETVLDLIHREKLGAVTAGRHYLIPDFELERYLRRQKSP